MVEGSDIAMIEFPNNTRVLTKSSELAILDAAIGCNDLFLDHETNSFDRTRGGNNPWIGDRIAGSAITWDDHPFAYYVPVRHTQANWNIPLDHFLEWHQKVVTRCKIWSNHNVRFDAHFSTADGAEFTGELFDTLNGMKMIDSDRGFGKGGYRLDALSSDVLDEDIDEHDQQVQAFLANMRPKSKNYADVPADIMGKYAGQDVLTSRKLKKYILEKVAEFTAVQPSFAKIWEIENKLVPVLYDMEKRGLCVNKQELQIKEFVLTTELLRLEEELHGETGMAVNPANSADCYELLINRFGLPILAWTDDKRTDADHNPSFDKDALKSYLRHPLVLENERYTNVIKKMLHYRQRYTLNNVFVKPFQNHMRDGLLHPQYNQLVRTGRMSCKQPNAQQQTDESKELIHPREGMAYLSADGSQIEFRLIASYANDPAIIAAYAENPDTDFHTWVAEMCGISRKPAKTVNFTIGYGGGKKKVVSQLSKDMELVGELMSSVDIMIAEGKIERSQRTMAWDYLCQQRGEEVYKQYHDTLPGIRRITQIAMATCKKYGYVFNAMGRRRSLPDKVAWRAFNSITQGLASDLVKAGMVALSPRYCEWTRSRGIHLLINVHDELDFEGETEMMRDPTTVATIVTRLEKIPCSLRVPIRFDAKICVQSWGAPQKLELDRSLAQEIE